MLSGGVFQNDLLLSDLRELLAGQALAIWTNHAVPPNDGGISLGQAALAAFAWKIRHKVTADCVPLTYRNPSVTMHIVLSQPRMCRLLNPAGW